VAWGLGGWRWIGAAGDEAGVLTTDPVGAWRQGGWGAMAWVAQEITPGIQWQSTFTLALDTLRRQGIQIVCSTQTRRREKDLLTRATTHPPLGPGEIGLAHLVAGVAARALDGLRIRR